MIDLDAIETARMSATPTPWRRCPCGTLECNAITGGPADVVVAILASSPEDDSTEQRRANADYIVALVNAAPDLLRRARAADALHALLARMNDRGLLARDERAALAAAVEMWPGTAAPERDGKGKEPDFDVTIALAQALRGHTWATHSAERSLQDEVDACLRANCLDFAREHRFDAKNRVDFFVKDATGCVALEVKIDGSNVEVARQLQRYAALDAVVGVVLLTTRLRHREMPPTLCGKRVEVVTVGRFM